ncbi:MAG: RHS repeat-associated core domain-containing protein [Sedimentibacter saalensis]|nr:RHS repeat-associated core domain-containing protein [Sedimentibacter saalensis]MEA5095220.1 RHS repeat-associated core domain-containing protein [Sedimentibacter saalensis]
MATVENTYTYDALHRVTSAHENYGNKTRTYQYDSLGNLTYETEFGNKSIDYKFNNLNQITKKSEDSWNTQNDFTYDRRGNLIQETYTKNSKISVTGEYTYDETNKMVLGVNELGESSTYLYNGLGALVENTWVIKKNAYGYHDVSALTNMVAGEVVVDPQTGKKDKKDKLAPEVVAASPELNKTSTVVKQFVVDYTSETFEPLIEYEVNSLEYRYVYGNDRLSVNITGVDTSAGNLIENVNQIRLYYHMDYLGTADYLTSPMTCKVESWTHYNEWGEITHNAVLKCGQRELDLVKRYATHDYDSVLSMYYAKARFYDAQNRRFDSIDPILDGSKYDITDYAKNPVQLVQYLYVRNNPVVYIDPHGEYYIQMYLKANEIPGKPWGAGVTVEGYSAVPETDGSALIKTLIQSAPFGAGDLLLKWYADNTYVGGNSMHDVDFSVLMAGLYEDMLIDEGFEVIAKKFGQDISGLYTVYDTIMTFDENIRIPMMDKEVFKLLNLSGINLIRSSVEEVEYIMDRSYVFTNKIEKYVFGRMWNIKPGAGIYKNLASPTFLDMDILILNSKNKEKTIKYYVDKYYSILYCYGRYEYNEEERY